MAQSEIAVSTTPPLPGTVLVEQINDAFQAVATQFSGSVDPAANAGAYMLWADTGTGKLKRRNAANSAWTEIGDLFPTSSGGTGATQIAVGTTAERPSVPVSGMIRQNSTTGNPEWYDVTSSQWFPFSQSTSYSINYLVVAGGGSGGASTYSAGGGAGGGGGGAGGLVTATGVSLTPGTAYTITVGAGGAAAGVGASGIYVNGNAGNNSSISSIATAFGGGFGGGAANGGNGGSGGGAGFSGTGGSGTSGQGNAGGNGAGSTAPFPGASGGGAGAAGANLSAGGVGLASSISGLSVFYAGGGGTTDANGTVRAGGNGGGGAGGITGTSGTANRGGGGGGSSSGSSGSGSGGSGIVIISYAGAQRGTGGTVTSVGGNTIHTFTSSGTFTA